MDDPSRKYDMPPDPDMIAQATTHACRATTQIAAFHQRMSWQIGRDGSHGSSHRGLLELAEDLESVVKSLRTIADQGDDRVTQKFKTS